MALIAPKRGEFFTPDGIPTHRFITWIENLTTTSNDNVTEIVNTAIRESFPWPTGQLASEVEQFTYPQPSFVETSVFRAATVTQNYTAQPNDFINAKSGATITFPLYPEENAVFIVRNGDGSSIKLEGNGRSINGSTTGTLNTQGTAIEFYYFIDTNEWFAK